jgi:hypothetical protein
MDERETDGSRHELVDRWSVTGTQEGDLFEMESSGEAFAEEGLNRFAIADDRIASVHSEWDTLKMVQELDVVSVAGPTG